LLLIFSGAEVRHRRDIAEAVAGEALAILVVNRLRGSLSVAAMHLYKTFRNKINNGAAVKTKTNTWNQLSPRRRQFEHLIFQSGSTVPQLEQDQMILGIDTPQLLNTFGPAGNELPGRRDAIETNAFDSAGQSDKLQGSNTHPVHIELVPTQTMTR